MIAVKSLLAHLSRPDVSEIVLESGRPPRIRVEGDLEEIGEPALSGDDVIGILFSNGGSHHLESLGTKPVQWRTRVQGVGAVVVSASQHGEAIEVHFALKDAPAPTVRPKTARPRNSQAPASRRDGAAPVSRRPKPRSVAPTPEEQRDIATPRVTGRRPEMASPTPVPGAPLEFETFATPPPPALPRGMMPTLPSNMEIDLDIRASEIPSVPHPGLLDDLSSPISPRTLPEARFSRDNAVLSPRAREVAFDVAPLRDIRNAPTPRPFEAVRSRPATQPSPRPSSRPSPEPAPPIGELGEPFAQSVRRPDVTALAEARAVVLPPPSPSAHGVAPALRERTSRTASGRTTRPFEREPHTSAFRKLLRAARDAGASDLHIVAGRPVLFRVAGQVVPKGEPLDPRVVEDMVLSRVPGRLAATLDRDGSCDFALEEPELGRFRVNASRQRTGVKASMRLIAPEIPTLAGLGLPDAIAQATRHHQGLIVLTGPTGHGKTTTLAAVIDILNRETTRHVITVEDPIEYVHPRRTALISQREVGTHTRSFGAALKATLREDPDVIVVGELRDTESMRAALSASETGHLVVGTMNTPSAAKTIDRIVDLFPPGDQQQVRMTLAGGLRLIVSQRLVPDAEGRRMVAAAEVLPGMVPLWNLIRDNRTYQIPSLQQRGKGLGVMRLDDSLLDLVRANRTTAAAALAVAEAPDEMEAVLGIRRQTGAVRPGTSPVPPRQEPRSSAPEGPATGPRTGGFFDRLMGSKKGS